MFTGVIQELGKLISIRMGGHTARVEVYAPKICRDAALGDSICTNGVCLTIARLSADTYAADLSSETIRRSSFAQARPGDILNLEPALRPIDRLGGHIVSGHVDGVGQVNALKEEGEFWELSIRFPTNLAPYIAEKGSLSIDGISLTVTGVDLDRAGFAVIPFTLENTNLKTKRPGDAVNLEVDLLARYVERLLAFGGKKTTSTLTLDRLKEFGFTDG